MAVWIVQFSSRLFFASFPILVGVNKKPNKDSMVSSSSRREEMMGLHKQVWAKGYIAASVWEMVRIRPNLRLRPRVHNFVGEWMAVICFDKTRKQRHFQFEFRCVNLKSGPFFLLYINIGRVKDNSIQFVSNFSLKSQFSCFVDSVLLSFTCFP